MPFPLRPESGTKRPKRRRASATSRRARAGLTLIELAVMMTILMLATAVLVPSFFRFQKASLLQWVARRVIGLAGEARGLAVSGDTVVRLVYEPQEHGIRMVVEPPEDADAAPATPTTSEKEPPMGERRTLDSRFLPLPQEVNLQIERDQPSDDASLSFYPDGRSEEVRVRLEEATFAPLVLEMNARTGRLRFAEAEE